MWLKRFSSLSGRRRRRKNVKHLLENAQLLTADKRSHLLIIVAFSAHLIIILLSYSQPILLLSYYLIILFSTRLITENSNNFAESGLQGLEHWRKKFRLFVWKKKKNIGSPSSGKCTLADGGELKRGHHL